MTDTLFEAKERAAAEIRNMMKIATPVALDQPNTKPKHKDAISWDYYKALFRVNGRWFEGITNKKRRHDRVFCEMKAVRDITDTRGASYSIMIGDASANTVAQNHKGSNDQTGRSGVRHSLAAMDQDYMAAVERGDMETAGRMVEEIARKADYTIRAYHFLSVRSRFPAEGWRRCSGRSERSCRSPTRSRESRRPGPDR